MIPKGLCQCGCGEQTKVIPYNNRSRGWVAGEPHKFIHGHQQRGRPFKTGPEYLEQDCGYETPCWVWQWTKIKDGYGRKHVDSKQYLAHRYYYVQARGEIPEGLELDHLCRNTSCVNPDHLEAVTHAENCRRGANAKLDAEAARQIHELAGDVAPRELAERFGVTVGQIRHILSGWCWNEETLNA